jgi:hypothetical protein
VSSEHWAVRLDEVPEVLRWQDGADLLDRVHGWWSTETLQRLDHLLLRLTTAQAAEVEATVEALDPAAGERLLEAPETTFRLWWSENPAEVGSFIVRGAAAERACAGRQPAAEGPLWTARGDFAMLTDGRVVRAPVISGLPTLDFGSPAGCALDLTGERYTIAEPRTPLDERERGIVVDRLRNLADQMPAASACVARFVERFTKALILQPDPGEPFSSGSNGQFVGRSAIGNPQLPTVDAAVLADALLHEAIHSFLYMQELSRSWVLDPALYDAVPRVTSPWTQRRLPLRPFLQACFVWYGLLNFWARAHAAGAFDETRRLQLLERAAAGFIGDRLVGALKPYRAACRDEVLVAVDEMQSDVSRCLTAAA